MYFLTFFSTVVYFVFESQKYRLYLVVLFEECVAFKGEDDSKSAANVHLGAPQGMPYKWIQTEYIRRWR